jgi:hypothetical protein
MPHVCPVTDVTRIMTFSPFRLKSNSLTELYFDLDCKVLEELVKAD